MKKISNELIEKIRPIVFYIVLFLFILAFCITTSDYDYDLWARLIIGKYIVQTGHVLKFDFVSYTPTHTLFDHEWGSSVLFYIVQHCFSHIGLLFLLVILIFMIYVVMIKTIKLRTTTSTTPYNFMFCFFSLSAMGIGLMVDQPIRCQVFSFLFFSIFLYILELSRKGENKLLWLLPFIMLIWNNMHGGCVAGIGLISIYIVGEFINKKSVKKYFLPFLLTLFVLPINPWGFSYLPFLFKATTMPRPDITEWQGLFNKHYINGYIEFKSFASVLILFEIGYIIKTVKNKTFKFDATKYLVLIVTLCLAIMHIKLIPLSVISMNIFLYDDFYTFFNFITLNAINKIANIKDCLIYLLILLFIIPNLHKKNFEPFLSMEKYPIMQIEFIKLNDLKGNLFVDFGVGSYTSYKLYPHNKIFMDGRYEEAYYDYMMPLLDKFLFVETNWDELLKKYPTDLIIIEKDYPVYKKLLDQVDWAEVFEDEEFSLFVRSKDLRKQYIIPSSNLQHYKDTLFDTDVDFKDAKWKKRKK